MSVFGDNSAILDIVPNDNNDLAVPVRQLYVGGAGDIVVIGARDGGTHTFKAVPVGTLLPIAVSRVKATNTTATFLLGLY